MCNTELRGSSGVIESPNFPNPYPHSRNCTWVIAAPLGNRVNLTFSHFDVESHSPSPSGTGVICAYDFVEIRQPNGTLGRFCSSALPTEIGSTQDKVMVQFVSDMSVAHNGFRLEWRVIGNRSNTNMPLILPAQINITYFLFHSLYFTRMWRKIG